MQGWQCQGNRGDSPTVKWRAELWGPLFPGKIKSRRQKGRRLKGFSLHLCGSAGIPAIYTRPKRSCILRHLPAGLGLSSKIDVSKALANIALRKRGDCLCTSRRSPLKKAKVEEKRKRRRRLGPGAWTQG